MTYEPRESQGVVDTVDDTVVDTHPTSESQASKLKQHLGEIAKQIFRVKLYIISCLHERLVERSPTRVG